MENSPLTSEPQAQEPSAVDDFSLGLLLYIINKSIIWLFLIVIVSFSLAIIYLRYTPRIYQATTTLILKQSKSSQILGVRSPVGQSSSDINQEIQLIKSSLFVQRVVDRLPLMVGYFKEGKTKLIASDQYTSSPFEVVVDTILDEEILNVPIYVKLLGGDKLIASFSLNGRDYDKAVRAGETLTNKYFSIRIKIKKTVDTKEPSIDIYNFKLLGRSAVIDEVADKIEVQPLDPSTNMIGMAYKDGNPDKARDIMAVVSTEFIKYDVEFKSESFQNILRFIDSQIDTFGTLFTRFQDSVALERIKDNYLERGGYLTTLSDKVTGYEMKFRDFEYDISLMKSLKQMLAATRVYSNLPTLKFKTAALDLNLEVARINTLQQQRNVLLLDATPQHPMVRQIDKQIEEEKIRLNKNINNAEEALQEEYTLTRNEFQRYMGEIMRYPALQTKYERLTNMGNIRNDFVNGLVSQKSNYLIAGAGIVSDYTILESARTDPNPVSPNELRIKLAGLLIGLILGIIMIAVRYLLHTTITSVEDVVKKTSASMLGVVPRYKEELQRSQVVVIQDPKSAITESFRAVRTNLQFISSTPGSKILSTTSTIPGEGKTFVSLNIAAILSLLNKIVFILDFDMRKPSLDKIFEVESHKGVSTILSGQTKVDDCIMESGIPNLDFITSGPVPPNPSELILLPKLQEVLAYLKTKYDYIIIDTPPIGLVTDALEILKISDYPIYILRAAYSNRSFVAAINRTMSENKIKNLSVILNDFGRGASGYGYGYGGTYGYNYGYGYSYGYSYYGSKYGEGYYTTDSKKKPKSWLTRILGEK